ncbi:MAG: substrate-binding domain-containing protein [Gammaproteobacteria bacterium]|nr:substrate-binding domain-containing protein [Gammaproteobacteria bacterium]
MKHTVFSKKLGAKTGKFFNLLKLPKRPKLRTAWPGIAGIVLATMLGLPQAAHSDEDMLMGAGAHFAWIVFDAIKEDLEKATGRKVILFGENSMLGVGCNAGVKAAKQNAPHHETFGFVCCPLSEQEIKENHLKVWPLAKEPILILVRDDNPVNNVSEDQVRAIFRGDITNWQEVGGPDSPIVLVTRLHCKDRPGHWKLILPNAKEFRQQRLNVKSAAAMVQRINDFSSAIGHTGSTWKFKPTDRVKALTINGVAPTAENLANGSYPFYRQLSAITNDKPSKDVIKLIQEAQYGASFHNVAKQYNLLPSNPLKMTRSVAQNH